MAPDPWLPLLAAARQLAQDIAERIQERNRCQRSGESSAKVNVAIRSSLQSLREKIEQLRELLLRAVSTRQITQLEGDRRQNLVDELLTRHKQLEASYRNEGPEPDVSRSSLMAGGAKRGNTNPWLLEESEETRGLGFDELRQQQRRIIEEQDAGLDALSSIISRQKQMGQEIGNELDEQNEIIDDLTNLVENTDDRLRNQTRHVKLVDKKSTSCGTVLPSLPSCPSYSRSPWMRWNWIFPFPMGWCGRGAAWHRAGSSRASPAHRVPPGRCSSLRDFLPSEGSWCADSSRGDQAHGGGSGVATVEIQELRLAGSSRALRGNCTPTHSLSGLGVSLGILVTDSSPVNGWLEGDRARCGLTLQCAGGSILRVRG
ncbi:syntaxin-8 isoform X1 [Parus major]|uniref:syntaxin-8 isoform X1 n=1 Tax=Parus major TaxID=9157 RepID=UPI0007712563|nr:syntaxin-8 isoform X1 [Parus major]